MCGIAGVWGASDARAPQLTQQMMDRLAHRGPDAQGRWDGPVGTLGHRRLSIVDIAGGDQPMRAAGGCAAGARCDDLVLVGNGEIYSAPVQREALVGEHGFSSRSDNEVALHLYGRDGLDGLMGLDGMYALAIADGDELILHRDPVGIKPLYTGRRDGALLFASELKAFPAGTTDIETFPPGATWSSETGWGPTRELPDPPATDASAEVHAKRVRETLEEAVVKRLMADVPVGAFVSGGLDSSSVAALAARHVDELHTFSVGVPGSPDVEAARAVADHIGSIHHEHLMEPDEVRAALPRIVASAESFDQDLVRHAVPNDLIAELAARTVKVVLTGSGADEIFAGYRYYADYSHEELRRELRRSVAELHDINIKRVDRLTMAHGLEARVPFLDLDVIEAGLATPVEWVQAAPDVPEKWLLREAVSDLLPDEVVWRDKEQFGDGAGATTMLDEVAAQVVGNTAVDEIRERYPDVPLRTDEEAAYLSMLVEAAENPEIIVDNATRWEVHRPDGQL